MKEDLGCMLGILAVRTANGRALTEQISGP